MSCNGLHMTIGEALDKLSILLLKKKYADEDKLDGKRWDGQEIDTEALINEINNLVSALAIHIPNIVFVVNTMVLAQANAAIFQLERGLRTCDFKSVDLAQAGLDSVKIRQENSIRTEIRKAIDSANR